jgi:hypothetical protein
MDAHSCGALAAVPGPDSQARKQIAESDVARSPRKFSTKHPVAVYFFGAGFFAIGFLATGFLAASLPPIRVRASVALNGN